MTQNVLVVGDWLLDEHWVVDVQRQPSSSRVGLRHSRALEPIGGTTRALCGAGQVASILASATDGTPSDGETTCCFTVYGIGLWAKRDGYILEQMMLNPGWAKGHTPHAVLPDKQIPENIKLCDLKASKLINLADGDTGDHVGSVGTTRVIRIYERLAERFVLTQRIDWESRIRDDDKDRIDQHIKERLDAAWWPDVRFDAVVIKDLGKDTVTRGLVEALLGRPELNESCWYISSKRWDPDWLEPLRLPKFANRVKLILLPQLSTWRATEERKVTSWLTRFGQATAEALGALEAYAACFNQAYVVALPDRLRILGRDVNPADRADGGLIQVEPSDADPALEFVPMASVFFPALVALTRLADNPRQESTTFRERLSRALDFTLDWMGREAGRLRNPKSWEPDSKQALNLQKSATPFGKWSGFRWETARSQWRSAFTKIVISVPGENPEHRIDLWRAMTEVPGYVCCVDRKRKELRRLADEVRRFRTGGVRGRPTGHDRKRHHQSYLLLDSPGSGKTYLVKCLAKALEMRFLTFNITQMTSRDDLIACFDKISSEQAENLGDDILVFVDEINSLSLNGRPAYDAFLAPIEEGVYVREERVHHIHPCIWVFASTDDLAHSSDSAIIDHAHGAGDNRDHREKGEKASDFLSRLTLPPFTLRINMNDPHATKQLQIERVYLGVSLLQEEFPDVQFVSQKVINVFSELPIDLSTRGLKNFVKQFREIRYGEVIGKNIPAWFMKEILKMESEVVDGLLSFQEEGYLVQIKSTES
jgi:hypothetical protein